MKPIVAVLGETLAEARAYCTARGLDQSLAISPRAMKNRGGLRGVLHGRVIVVPGVEPDRYTRALLERFEVVFGA